MATQLNLDDTVVVLIKQSVCKGPEGSVEAEEGVLSIVLRMRSFHITCVFLSVVGKHFRDVGLRDLLLESVAVVHLMVS